MEREVRPGEEHGVVAPVPVDPTGRRGPTRRRAAEPEWRRSSRGLYVTVHVGRGAEQRIVEVGVRVPSGTQVTGWAARRWRGATWFTGLVWTSSRPGQASRSVVDGLAVTGAVVPVVHDMKHAATLTAAVQALDMAAYADLVSVAEALGGPGRPWEALYRRHALEVVVTTAPDLGRPKAFRERLDTACARASSRAAVDRSWTHVAAAWWVPTDTVERRRALTPAQRRRWVRRGRPPGDAEDLR